MPARGWRRRCGCGGPAEARTGGIVDGGLRGGVAQTLETALRDLEVVDGKVPRLKVGRKVEALGEHGLHHQAHLFIAIVAA